jgi:hypothetical protein
VAPPSTLMATPSIPVGPTWMEPEPLPERMASAIASARLTGMANPPPPLVIWKVCVPAVTMPTTWPAGSTSGPPESPGPDVSREPDQVRKFLDAAGQLVGWR